MHESTQRELCRLIFIFLGLIPLIAIASFSVIRNTPWYQRFQKEQWQQRISDDLGVEVRISSIEFPGPDRIRARNLVCLHPETGKKILTVSQVNASRDRAGWTVDLVSPELNGPQIQNAMQVIHDWFICRPQKSASLLNLSVPELLVRNEDGNTKLQHIEVGLKPTESVSSLFIKFSIEGQPFAEPNFLKIERNHAIDTPTTLVKLISNNSIPCRVLSQRFPSFLYLGDQAGFRGTMAWAYSDQHWETSINGIFTSIDFAVATSRIGSPIRGAGDLSIAARFADSGLLEANGSIISIGSSGTVNAEWFQRALQLLGLRLNNPEEMKHLKEKFSALTQVAAQFKLDPNGLTINGLIPPDQVGYPKIAMIVDGTKIYEPSEVAKTRMVAEWLQASSSNAVAPSQRVATDPTLNSLRMRAK